MNRRTLIVLGAVAAVALVGAVADVQAACNPARTFYTIDQATPNYRYLNFPAGADAAIGGPSLIGRHWEPGNRGAHNEGPACPESAYLLEFEPGKLGILGALGGNIIGADCLNVGCPPTGMVILIQTRSTDGSKAYYAAGRVDQFGGSYNFAANTDWPVVEMPRPRVTSSSRGGNTVTIGAQFDAPNGARGETGYPAQQILTGYQIVKFEGAADPGRAQNLWTPVGSPLAVTPTGASVGGVGITCASTATDAFVATRLIFDNGQYLSDYVSEPTRVECDPAVADPRFKMIDRTKSGRGGIRQNPR
jgi:hypothetical protein